MTDEVDENNEEDLALKSGYAQVSVRVQKLGELAERLQTMIADDDKVWQKEFKMVGKDMVETIKFNNALLKEYRDTLGDIADEMGARTKKQEPTAAETSNVPQSILTVIEQIYGDNDNQL